jgi:hypothetical protein
MYINDKEINAHAYTEGVVVAEVLDYINRVSIINGPEQAEGFDAWLKGIEAELRLIATNRKFLVLNTNVIRTIHARVLSNESVRAFYLEIMTSLRARMAWEHGPDAMDKVLDELVRSYKHPLAKGSSLDNPNQTLVKLDSNYNTFASQLTVMPEVKNYLENNEWYYGFILCNFFVTAIVNQIDLLRATKTGQQ